MSYFEGELSYEQTRDAKEVLQSLLESEGWKFVRELIDERVRGRTHELYQMTPDSVEKMVAFAKIRGSIEELTLFPQIVESMYTDLQNAVKAMQDEMTDPDGQGDLFDDR